MSHLRDRFRGAVETVIHTPGAHDTRISDTAVRRRPRESNLSFRRPNTGAE